MVTLLLFDLGCQEKSGENVGAFLKWESKEFTTETTERTEEDRGKGKSKIHNGGHEAHGGSDGCEPLGPG